MFERENIKYSLLILTAWLGVLVLIVWVSVLESTKIIGLVAVRNEELLIKQCLRGLACYTDEIIVLDDASDDNTVAIIKDLIQECNITKIITKDTWYRDEGKDRNLLLTVGRECGGTHFVMLDADELFTANCRDNNILRDNILALQPGDSLLMHWIQLRNSIWQFKCRNAELKQFAFCDDGQARYADNYLHVKRVPKGMKGNNIDFGRYATHGVLHFKEVDLRNLRIRQAWYQCLERINRPKVAPQKIAKHYTRLLDESNMVLADCPVYWFAYDFFDEMTCQQPDTWRRKQIGDWIDTYGYEYFKDLDIWEI